MEPDSEQELLSVAVAVVTGESLREVSEDSEVSVSQLEQHGREEGLE